MTLLAVDPFYKIQEGHADTDCETVDRASHDDATIASGRVLS